MSKLVYLAGPILALTYDECTEWRQQAIIELRKYGITGLSPMRGKEFLREHKGPLTKDVVHMLTTDSAITIRDKWDVKQSDAVLFNLLKAPKVSIGTVVEYGWASAFDKPIVTIMEDEGNLHEHAMIRRLSAYRVKTLEEGLEVVKALFAY